jgi:hypothetical protein
MRQFDHRRPKVGLPLKNSRHAFILKITNEEDTAL